MAHNFLHGTPPQASPGLPGEPKALIDRFLDAIWMERGLSENTLGAYRADLVALNQRLATRGVELARASRADVLEAVVRQLARVTPREGEWEHSYRALQQQARRALTLPAS